MKTDTATRKKHKIYQSPTVKIQPLPNRSHHSGATPTTSLQEQKDRFLKHGKTPVFVVQGDTSTVDELASRTSGKIRFDLLGEAQHILHTVKQKYGVGENFLEHIYGPHIDQDEANQILFEYIKENSLQESLSVYWSNDLNCSARMVWKGYSFKCNRPEMRRYSLWLNGTSENPYLRRYGLRCLLDHEIGTHFYRNFNDGLQPWFSDRKKFGLRSAGSFESLCTEEGLAAINTTLRAKEKYLWLSALVYYTACKSTEMTFKQLFDHLGQFLDSPEQRWKHVMRVKRGLVDPNDLGGYGKDQCYFEGAVTILRNLDEINFQLLMSGKICYDEVVRIKRLARTGSIALPAIMRNMNDYRKQLKRMAMINGLHIPQPPYMPSKAYLQRLKEREAGIVQRRKVRKRKKSHASLSNQSSTESDTSSSLIISIVQPAGNSHSATLVQEQTIETPALQTDHEQPAKQPEDSTKASPSPNKKLLAVRKSPPPKISPVEMVKKVGAVHETYWELRMLDSPHPTSELVSRNKNEIGRDKLSMQACLSDSCSDFEVSAQQCSKVFGQGSSPSKDSKLPQPRERPKTAIVIPHNHISALHTLGSGKLEITQVCRKKNISEAGHAWCSRCDGLTCSQPLSSPRTDSDCSTPDIQSWLLTVTPVPPTSVHSAAAGSAPATSRAKH